MNIIDRPIDIQALSLLTAAQLTPALARLYASRGIQEKEALSNTLKGLPPFQGLKGVAKAAELLVEAIENQKRLLIVADYDADGATACALGWRGLRMLGGQVDFIVPNRFEFGYGLTPEIVEVAAQRCPDLIITVDNGISSLAGVARANELGICVIVTDHHLPGDQLPAAAAIVNPNQPGCAFPSKHLAGVGVMFYVLLAMRALLRERGHFNQQAQPNLAVLLDLVALGTVADMVCLDAVNRILVHQGIERIRANQMCAGIQALFKVARCSFSTAHCDDLGYRLGPRLNAAGRLEDMSLGIQALITDDPERAEQIANELDSLNQVRRALQSDIQAEALADVDPHTVETHYTLCLHRPHWGVGIIGLIASRLTELFHRPAFVFTVYDAQRLKASGRSIAGFHLRDALDLISKKYPELFISFGGHAAAAGVMIKADHLPLFKEAFEQVARAQLSPHALRKVIETDGELAPHEFNVLLADQLERAVWGQAFPAPLYRGCFTVQQQQRVGACHLRLRLVLEAGHSVEAIAFNQLEDWPAHVLLVYRLAVNRYAGKQRLQLIIQHWQPLDRLSTMAGVGADYARYLALA